MQKRTINNVLYPLFFITGAVGLIYQVLWVRMFGLIFGNTIFASSTVLAAYMAGMALGSYLSGKYLSGSGRFHPLKLYAWMELIVGIFGVSMPAVKQLIEMIYTDFFQALNPSFATLTIFRSFLSFIVLVVPCIFMGATLPVLSKYISDSEQMKKSVIGKLYGINTIGAVAGCLLTGFLFIGRLGLTKTSILGAVLDFLVALLSFVMYKKSIVSKASPTQTKRNQEAAKQNNSLADARKNMGTELTVVNKRIKVVLLITYALSGFAALALEVAWQRAMVWVMSMDSYAYAAMLAVILSGLGIGSLVYTRISRKIRSEKAFLIAVQFLIGVFVLVSIAMVQHSTAIKSGLENVLNNMGIFKVIYNVINPITLSQLLLSAIIMFMPSLLMGMAFPLFSGLYVNLSGSVGKGVGNIYSANTCGSILGSLVMGFIIMPTFGLLPSIAIMACIYFLITILLFLAFSTCTARSKVLRLSGIAAVACILVAVSDLDSVNYIKTTLSEGNTGGNDKLIYFKENATGDVLVKWSSEYGNEMLIDGVQVASDGDFDLHSHIYPAHLMSLLKEDPDDVLVVAFGCGGTSGSILKYNDVASLDVVEICDGVVEPAIEYFSTMNSNVFASPKLNLVIQDGKNYVHMVDKKYDIIYSGPIHPQSNQGSAALYTEEYFEDCKAKLKDDGFQCLWLPMHMSSAEDFKIIVKTFLNVYPYASMWILPDTDTSVAHPHLIGSMQPIYPDYSVISEKLKRPGIIEDLERMNDTAFTNPYEFISQLAIGTEGLKRFVGETTSLNTDDLPVVEFYTRTNNYLASTAASKAMLLAETVKYMENPYQYVRNVPDKEKAVLNKQLERLYEGNKALIMGHYYFTAKQIIQSNVDPYIRDYYAKAFELIPESQYLKKYFGEYTN